MSWIGVITDAGRTLLSQYVSGGAIINIDRITVGSGLVSEESMREAVNLTYYRDTGTIVSKSDVSHGVDFELQINPCRAGAYVAREIGMWANAEEGDPVLLALFQNTDGVDIPAFTTNPDFVYLISAILVIDDLDNLTITVDSTAFVPYAVFNPYKASVEVALDGKVDKEAGKGLSQANFTNSEKTKLAGIETNANKYVLPVATDSTLGGVKIGAAIGVNSSGTIRNAGVRSVATGTANGTISVNTDGTAANVPVKGLGSAAYRDASSLANASHTHNASDITAGTLPVARGGTGITTNPSALTNLASENAANVFASAPRPGVTGTLPIAHGGTGMTSNPSLLVNLESGNAASAFASAPRPGVTGTLPISKGGTGATSAGDARTNLGVAAASHTHNASDITAGTLPVARGGTGVTSNPSMLTNLGSTSAAGVFASAPRPGVTGTLPVANGGTGATTAANARTNLGAAAADHTHTPASIGAAPASHTHSASDITSGTLPVARGGTGITSNPSMLTNLGSTTAGNVFTASPRPGVTGTLPVNNGGTGATTAADARTNLGAAAANHTHTPASIGAAAASHTHSAGDITSGTLPIARGGTGMTTNPSMLTNLGSTTAGNVFATSPRPGVTGTLPVANGGTGATTAANARTNLGAAAASHTHNASDITAGTLPVARGGTGITSNPSMLTNLGSTTAGSVFATSPRPGVTGTLPVANGGTGATTAANARTNLGAAAANHTHSPANITGMPDTIGYFTGNGARARTIDIGFKPTRVILFSCRTGDGKLLQYHYSATGGVFCLTRGLNIVYAQDFPTYGKIEDDSAFISYLGNTGRGGAAISSNGMIVGYGDFDYNEAEHYINTPDWQYMYYAWR